MTPEEALERFLKLVNRDGEKCPKVVGIVVTDSGKGVSISLCHESDIEITRLGVDTILKV